MPSTAAKTVRESALQEAAGPTALEKFEEIARLAYSYWEAAGCPSGTAEEDWLRAEHELESIQSEGASSAP